MGCPLWKGDCSFFHCEKRGNPKCYNQTLQNNNDIVIHIFRIFIGEYNYFSKAKKTTPLSFSLVMRYRRDMFWSLIHHHRATFFNVIVTPYIANNFPFLKSSIPLMLISVPHTCIWLSFRASFQLHITNSQ